MEVGGGKSIRKISRVARDPKRTDVCCLKPIRMCSSSLYHLRLFIHVHAHATIKQRASIQDKAQVVNNTPNPVMIYLGAPAPMLMQPQQQMYPPVLKLTPLLRYKRMLPTEGCAPVPTSPSWLLVVRKRKVGGG